MMRVRCTTQADSSLTQDRIYDHVMIQDGNVMMVDDHDNQNSFPLEYFERLSSGGTHYIDADDYRIYPGNIDNQNASMVVLVPPESEGYADENALILVFATQEKADAVLTVLRGDLSVMTTSVGWEFLPEDLRTHLHDFEKACDIAKTVADGDDVDYWQKQLDTITNIRKQLGET